LRTTSGESNITMFLTLYLNLAPPSGIEQKYQNALAPKYENGTDKFQRKSGVAQM
jgi:hypothetical protein